MKAVLVVLLLAFAIYAQAEEVAQKTEDGQDYGYPKGSQLLTTKGFRAVQILFGRNGKTRDKHIRLKLLYSSAKHGWSAYTMHHRINYKGATLSLYRDTAGSLFGGYYSKSWVSRNNYNYRNEDSWVFRLRRGWHDSNTKPFKVLCGAWCSRYRIYDNNCYRVTFGGGHDLFGGGNCWGTGHSYYRRGYHYTWMYTQIARGYPGQYRRPYTYWMGGNRWFTLSALEVYRVYGITAAERRASRLYREKQAKKEKKKKKEKQKKKIAREKKIKNHIARQVAEKLKKRQNRLEKLSKKASLAKSKKHRAALRKKLLAARRELARRLEKGKKEERNKVIKKKKQLEKDRKYLKKALKSKRAFKRVKAKEKLSKAKAAYAKAKYLRKIERAQKNGAKRQAKAEAVNAKGKARAKMLYWSRGWHQAAKADDTVLNKFGARHIRSRATGIKMKKMMALK